MDLKGLELHPYTTATLQNHGIHTLEDLLFLSEKELIKIKNVGKRKVEEIKLALHKKGYSLVAIEEDSELQMKSIEDRIAYHKAELNQLYLQKEIFKKTSSVKTG